MVQAQGCKPPEACVLVCVCVFVCYMFVCVICQAQEPSRVTRVCFQNGVFGFE